MQSINQFFLTFLLNAAWQAALITLAAAACARLLGGAPARYRYLVWVSALSLSLLLPVLTSPQFTFAGVSGLQPSPPPQITAATDISLAPPALTGETAAETPPLTIPIGANLAIALLAAYTLFLFYSAARLFRAYLRTRGIARSAYHAPLPDHVQAALEKCRKAIGGSRAAVLCSGAVPVPVTIGSRRPLVILPETFLRETDQDVLVTAIGHELVHVRRRDYLFNLIVEILSLPLSFHPAAMLAKRRIAEERELCCDEIVARRLLTAEVYARSLVTIAGSAANLNRLVPTTTVGITDAGNLEVRIMSLLKKSEISSYKKGLLIVAAVLLLAIPCVVAAVFVPRVGIDDAALTPSGVMPGATPPKAEAMSDERREKLERELKELQESDLDPSEKQARKEKLEREFKELQGGKTESIREQKERVEKLARELKELQEAGAAMDLGEMEARRKKLELELKRLHGLNETESEDQRLKLQQERAEKLEKEKMAAEARITMDQAIQNALNHQPGTLAEKGIGRTREGEVVYKIFVRDAGGNMTLVIVSGVDGRVIKTEKAL